MDDTPNLKLPYIAAAQAQKHVTHNEALRLIDALVQISVVDRDLAEPPAEPADGERHIVASPAAGAWSGKDGRIAAFQDNAWAFLEPNEGWLAWIADEDVFLVFDGAAWAPFAGGIQSVNPVPLVGVNTLADATNRLAAKSDAVLFSHDDVTPGDGSIRFKVNKAAAEKTASLLFQDDWSGRAEVGLAGDDDFHFKVSADGATWRDAIVIDKDTGAVAFPHSSLRETLSAHRTYYVRPDGDDANDGLSNTAAGAFLTLSGAYAAVAARIDGAGFDVTLSLAAGSYAGVVATAPLIGVRELKILGNTSTPSSVVVGASYIEGDIAISFSGVTLAASGNIAISIKIGTLRIRAAVVFEAASIHIWLRDRAICNVDNDYTIAAGATQHLRLDAQAYFFAGGRTITLTGTPAFSQFLFAQQLALAGFYSCAFSGSATGTRYNVTKYALVDSFGSGTSFLPGNAAGTTSSGGAYI